MRARNYISYSQMITVENSPEQYIQKYLYENSPRINKAQEFGKRISDALETGESTGDLLLDMVISKVPNYEIKDQEVTAMLGDIPVLIKPDGLTKDYKEIIEHKSGPKGSWTQKKADTWDQITFYCMGVYLLTGEIPKAKLIHVITENDGRNYWATGDIKIFNTERTYKDILIMMGKTKRAWKKIEEIINKELL